jgi:hypothetical protein
MKAYKHLLGYRFVHPCFSLLWKSTAQKKHKVFFWLLLKDRLSTRNILRCKNRALTSYDYVLCFDACEETVEHLFWIVPLQELVGPCFIFRSPRGILFKFFLHYETNLIRTFSWISLLSWAGVFGWLGMTKSSEGPCQMYLQSSTVLSQNLP